MKIAGMEIKGLKNAIGEYQRANAGGYFNPQYGYLMLDLSTGDIWTDVFYSLGHNEWREYHSSSIINLGRLIIQTTGKPINMSSVKSFLTEHMDALREQGRQ